LFTEYTTPVEGRQSEAGPETGLRFTLPVVTVTVNDALLFPQVLLADTEMFPEDAEELQLVVIELVPCPDVMVTPEGTCQEKETLS